MKKSLQSVGSLCALTLAFGAGLASPSFAMDYASLESLFGEPVTVNATGTPQRASDVAANMTIITADQIRHSGSRSIPEIIGDYVPGVDVLRTSSGDYSVGVRGFQQIFQPRLLVLVDGRQVFIDDYSRTVWNNIPVNIDDVRQIEVVKGPASALFGSNAASGVVNIVTYNAVSDKNNVASLTMGTQNTINGDATVTQNGSWGGTKFSLGGYNAREFDTQRSPADVADFYHPDRRYVTNSTSVQITPDLTANGEFTYSDSRQNAALSSFNMMGAEQTKTYSVRGGVAWQSDFGTITTDTYLNHSYDTIMTTLSGTIPFAMTTDLVVTSVNDQFSVGNDHTFRVGLEYRHKDFDLTEAQTPYAGDPSPQPEPAFAEDNYAVSGTWLWQINDKLSWTNSLRIDHQDMQQTGTLPVTALFTNSDYSHAINTWSANSALNYKMTENDTFHLTYGRGVQMPSLLQSSTNFYTTNPGYPLSYQGNPNLKPTITQSYELGYDRKIAPIHSTAKVSGFYQMTQDVTAFVNKGMQLVGGGATAFLMQATNLGNSSAYGGEVELLGNYAGFRWDASYSFARVADSGGVVAGGQPYDGSSPEHHFRLSGGYTYHDWEFDANTQAVSSVNMLRNTGMMSYDLPVSSYMTVGARIGYNINDKLTVAVSGTNLNRHFTETSPYPAVERQAFVTLTGRF